MEYDEWVSEANCQGTPTDVFFPVDPSRPGAYDVARSICADCKVSDDCLQYAIDRKYTTGMYGGLTPYQRDPNNSFKRNQRVDHAVWDEGDPDNQYVPDEFDLWEFSGRGIRELSEVRARRRAILARVDAELAGEVEVV